MKLLIKYYSKSFCSLIKAEEIEIKSKSISVSQLKEQISAKFHIPKSEIILTIKYDDNKKNRLITLSDEFPLYYFFIHYNSEILLEHYEKIDKTKEICEKIKNSKSKKLKHLKRLQIFSDNKNTNTKKNLDIIKESDNEYTEIDSNNEELKNNIIKQAIQFIIEDKVVPFKEYIYINEFIQEDLSILTTQENGWNALHYSCFYGREEMTETLIKLFNPSVELINGLTNDGYTPLHLACIKGHINIVRILLFLKEIDVNIVNKKDGTALHIACKKNNMQIVSILVSFKADLNIKDSKNKLPIDLTTDENIKKILKKAMIYTSKEDESNLITGETELSMYVDNFFTPPKPPITIGHIEKRGNILPTYSHIFIEVNPTLNCIKKYKNSSEYPKNHYGIIDLNLVNSCKREFAKAKDMFYFSVNHSSKDIFRVKNEGSFNKWIKVINESIIFCRYWSRIEKINRNAHDFLNKQKNIIEIIEENGEVKNYEEEQKRKNEERNELVRETMLKNLNKEENTIKKLDVKEPEKKEKDKITIKDNNKNTNINPNTGPKKINLHIQLLDDSGKKGINLKSFEKVDLQFHYLFGNVFKVKLKEKNDNNETLILKKIKKRELYRLKQIKNVENEINLIKQCDSPFILKIIHSFQDKKNIYMVEEFCPGGNLKWHINLNLFEEDEAKFYIAELILAIEYLHKKNLCFKNLKSEKILINDKNHIQLIGYGIVKEDSKEENENNFFGINDEYISPELLSLRGKDKMADIYGIGVVLYEMVCGTKPFYSKENVNLFNNDFNKNKLMMNEYFSMELKNLLIKLLCKDPKERVQDISEIKKHIFFKDIDWNKLGKMQIVPPLNLVKNKIENKDIICFKSRKKKEQKDYFLDFHITKNVEHFTFIRKYGHNKNDNENNSNINYNIVKEKNGNKTENVIINIDENYIESSEQSKNGHK
jgi:serine/threonine protein kinase/ankyrin repeat protein